MDSRKKSAAAHPAALITTCIFVLLLLLAGGIFFIPGVLRKGSISDIKTDSDSLYSKLGIDIVMEVLDTDNTQDVAGPLQGANITETAAAAETGSEPPNTPEARVSDSELTSSGTGSSAVSSTDTSGKAAAGTSRKDPDTASSKVSQKVPATATNTASSTTGTSAKESSSKTDQAVLKQENPANTTDKSVSAKDTSASSDPKKESKKKDSEKKSSEEKSSEEKASEKKASDKEASEKEASEKKTSEKEASEKKASEKEASEKKTSEKEASEKKASEKKASDKKNSAETQKVSEAKFTSLAKESDPENSEDSPGEDNSSDPKDSLTKQQKKHIKAWEDFHGYPFTINAPLNDYNWKYLDRTDDGRLSYEGDDRYTILHGIDVSEFQGKIDWERVKKAGFDFVFIRAGYRTFDYGDLNKDSRAVKNLRRAKRAGLDVGLYFFSQAVTKDEAREEAQLCLDVLEKSGVELTLPIAFDPEIQLENDARINYISKEQFTENAVAFCKKIKEAGYIPAIYANSSTETDILDMSRLDDVVIWYADYNQVPESPYRFTFWQYSETGSVDGIPEPVTDLNVWFIEKDPDQ